MMRNHPAEVEKLKSLRPEEQEDLLSSLISRHENILEQFKAHVNLLSNLKELSHLNLNKVVEMAAAFTHSDPNEPMESRDPKEPKELNEPKRTDLSAIIGA